MLTKNLSNFVSLQSKLDNPYYHTSHKEWTYAAMKIIKNPDASSWNEVELLKKSQHDNVIKYYKSFKCINTGYLCIVMEYCDKGTLTNFLARVRNELLLTSNSRKISTIISI